MNENNFLGRKIRIDFNEINILEEILSKDDFEYIKINISDELIYFNSIEFEEKYVDILTTALARHGFDKNYELTKIGLCLDSLVNRALA